MRVSAQSCASLEVVMVLWVLLRTPASNSESLFWFYQNSIVASNPPMSFSFLLTDTVFSSGIQLKRTPSSDIEVTLSSVVDDHGSRKFNDELTKSFRSGGRTGCVAIEGWQLVNGQLKPNLTVVDCQDDRRFICAVKVPWIVSQICATLFPQSRGVSLRVEP